MTRAAPPDPRAARLRADPAFAALKGWAVATTGMSFLNGRDDSVAAALLRRMEAGGFGSPAQYLRRLESPDGEAEREALIGELTIGETYFFRFRAQWDAFADLVVPNILDRNRALRRLHLWCAGCATGPEPYTAAILLHDLFGQRLKGWDLRILGSDLNRGFLEEAGRAVYSDWALRATPDEVRARCFDRSGRDWVLKPGYRRGVEFHRHNLVHDPYPPADGFSPDLILCRNVFIYFDTATNRTVVSRFRDLLGDGGWLMVGHAETDVRLFDGFETVALKDTMLYRRTDRPSARRPFARARGPARPVLCPPKGRTPLRPGGRPAVTARRETAVAPPAAAMPAPAMPAPAMPAPAMPAPAVRPEPAPPPAALTPGPVPPEPAPDLPERYRAILELLAADALPEAARLSLDWLTEDVMTPWPHLALAAVFGHRGDSARCEKALRDALYLDRTLLLAHYELGCLLRPTDAAAARRSFRTVVGLSDRLPADGPVPGAPALTVAELRAAATLQLDRLGAAP
ncbi:CheR family methyltransferase [Rhodocista pekingensis]|uniref:protein-glutamate O-methyltransferase n=1 Tax=Rhodocista pekingensis TaxID=201185 RepID=A0ABW2KW40_9PROT